MTRAELREAHETFMRQKFRDRLSLGVLVHLFSSRAWHSGIETARGKACA